MAFCHNCGAAHDDGDMFCQSCGAKLTVDKRSAPVGEVISDGVATMTTMATSVVGGSNPWLGTSVRVAAQFTQIVIQGLFDVDFGLDFFKSGSAPAPLRGVMMTNIARLSKRFSVSPEQIRELLESYITSLSHCGVDYILLDGSDKGCEDSWIDYSQQLTNIHIANFRGSQQPVFLFIVGGDDIVPMPIIDNLFYHARQAAGDKNYHDKDVDTDLPYAYLLGEHTQKMIYSGELFNYNPYYCVGRLPFDEKCDINTLIGYLKRSFQSHKEGGINVDSTYGQTYKAWRNESTITSGVLNENNLLPAYSNKYTDDFAFNNLLTSPGVVVGNIQSAFNTDATLLFFNMHGSDNPSNPNFMGESISFSPKQLQTLNRANIVVSEACYGAKFKGLDSEYSMLLTALSSNTLIYFGSSRIALGGGGSTYERVEDLLSADLYFKYLLDAITLGGFPVAYSVEYARQKYIQARERLGLKDLLTIAEFNLYGDPTLRSYFGTCEQSYKEAEQMKIAPLAEGKQDCGFTIETLYENKSDSLLSMIRSQVDASLKEIVDTINKELYERHGLKPRDLSSVAKVCYKDGSSNMEFVYSTKSGDLNKIYLVEVDGGVSKVLISK